MPTRIGSELSLASIRLSTIGLLFAYNLTVFNCKLPTTHISTFLISDLIHLVIMKDPFPM
jgi:hypothetical protein